MTDKERIIAWLKELAVISLGAIWFAVIFAVGIKIFLAILQG